MDKKLLVLGTLLAGILSLNACAAPLQAVVPVETTVSDDSVEGMPTIEVETLPAATEAIETEPVLTMEPEPELSYEAEIYLEETAGIELYYPVDWSESPRQQIGERGAQAALLSPGSTLEQTAEGDARILLTTYEWEPKHDLEAYVDQRKLAWDASGFKVLQEEMFTLEDGRQVMVFNVEVGGGSEAVFAFVTAGEDYLQISGDGDLDLCMEIIKSMKVTE